MFGLCGGWNGLRPLVIFEKASLCRTNSFIAASTATAGKSKENGPNLASWLDIHIIL